MKITVTLKGLVTKEFTVPTANILRKEAPTGMTFADQNGQDHRPRPRERHEYAPPWRT